MGYERNDRRWSGGQDQGRDRNEGRARWYGGADERGDTRSDYRGDRHGDDRGRDYGRDPRGYDYQDRGFFDRAGDEVRSWFGDEEAERRRRYDERQDDMRESRGDYGYGQNRQNERGSYFGGSQQREQRGRHDHDPNYRNWRDRQIEALDREYDDYRREHQGRFDTDYGSWRQGRQTQRDSLSRVQEHQEVVGSDDQHIGTVDHVRGDRILLTKNDEAASGRHHSIPSSWIQSVDDKVRLGKTADQAKALWRDEEREGGGLFGGDRDRSTDLNRSFSGTY